MAELRLQDGSRVTELHDIAQHLAPLGVTLHYWPLPEGPRAAQLRGAQALSAEEQDELLSLVDHRFRSLQEEFGYEARDLIVLHEDIPDLAGALAKFADIHYHEDDEVRYILDGAGYFGFVTATGDQMLLKVASGDYINVPARTEHWFVMRDSPRIKAVRYFIDKEGWVPVYTNTAVALA